MSFTSVTGHLFELDFPPAFSSWESTALEALWTAPTLQRVPSDKTPLLQQLHAEARRADWLILWLDCDREGENIAFEVLTVCTQARSSAPLRVLRARFSALIPADIHHALASLTVPNRHLSDAVDARMEIDLRIGAAFTRFQTLLLRGSGVGQALSQAVVSYGPCQFPTLGFVVEAWKRRMAFVRERYWAIGMEWQSGGDAVRFTWLRGRVFDRAACMLLYEMVCESEVVCVERVECKERKRHRPLPLSTVELQKRLSQHARLSAQRSMEVAEKLYQRGLISYPRTETDRYKEGTDMQQLLVTLSALPGDCGAYADKLLTGAFVYPGDGGHDDSAHPPIHPTKADATLSGEEKTVYEFVVRHFLGCCSADAIGQETVVTAQCRPSGETFAARGLMITQRNYLEVYTYDRWYGAVIPVFTQSQSLTGVRLTLTDGQTNPPPLLTESDLIAAMDRHGIGTDATIAQHIDTIQKRKYVTVAQRTFVPTALGLGLVEGYEELGLGLGNPGLRAHMEELMKLVGEGRKAKADVVSEVVRDMSALLVTVQERSRTLSHRVEEELMRDATPEQRVLQQGLPLRDEDDAAAALADGRPAGAGGRGGGAAPGRGGAEGPRHQPARRGDHSRAQLDLNRVDGPLHSLPDPSESRGVSGSLSSDELSPLATIRRRRKGTAAAEKKRKPAARGGRHARSPPPAFPSRSPSSTAITSNVCFHCQQPGHFASRCPAKAQAQPAQWGGGGAAGGAGGAAGGVSGDVECFTCGGRGHYASVCPSRR